MNICRKAVEEELENLLFELGIIEFNFNQTFEDIGLDSLDVIELKLEAEEKFGVYFKDGAVTFSSTPNDIVNLIMKDNGH